MKSFLKVSFFPSKLILTHSHVSRFILQIVTVLLKDKLIYKVDKNYAILCVCVCVDQDLDGGYIRKMNHTCS